MLNSQKNIIFENLRESAFGIDAFEFQENEKSFEITFKDDLQPLVYKFLVAPNSFDMFTSVASRFGPGFSMVQRVVNYSTFNEVFMDFVRWMHQVVFRYNDEKALPDLWSEYIKREKLIPIKETDYKDNDSFTIDEKVQLDLGLNELKLLITKKFALDAAHQEVMEERMTYLSESLERATNKTDWKGILINTIISISIALSLDTQKGQELYNMFISIMQILPAIGN